MSEADTIGSLRTRIEKEHHADLMGRPLSRDPAGLQPIADHLTMKEAKVGNGEMLFAMIDEEVSGVHEQATRTKRTITKEGNIVALDYHSNAASAGFRPGMLPLRSMKMQWTLNEFVSLDEQVLNTVCKRASSFHHFHDIFASLFTSSSGKRRQCAKACLSITEPSLALLTT